MTAKVKKLQNVYLAARNVAAQSAFYDSVLGLPLKFRDGDRWVQYTTGEGGNTGFSLACLDEAKPAESGAVLVFEVEDFDGVETQVAQAGGEVTGIRDMGSHGAVLSLRDPEGNIVQMFRRAPKAD
jgi:predicted enzyme related to lactoylglutathione lyase